MYIEKVLEKYIKPCVCIYIYNIYNIFLYICVQDVYNHVQS